MGQTRIAVHARLRVVGAEHGAGLVVMKRFIDSIGRVRVSNRARQDYSEIGDEVALERCAAVPFELELCCQRSDIPHIISSKSSFLMPPAELRIRWRERSRRI